MKGSLKIKDEVFERDSAGATTASKAIIIDNAYYALVTAIDKLTEVISRRG